MIKVSAIGIAEEEKSQKIEGFASGKRSAILEKDGKLFRLKGCGNLNEGFPTEPLDSLVENAKEIRGCAFEHTAFRELHY